MKFYNKKGGGIYTPAHCAHCAQVHATFSFTQLPLAWATSASPKIYPRKVGGQYLLESTVPKNWTTDISACKQDQRSINILWDFSGMTLDVKQAVGQELTTEAPQSSQNTRMSKEGSNWEAEVQ
jgi:hypothetical protein